MLAGGLAAFDDGFEAGSFLLVGWAVLDAAAFTVSPDEARHQNCTGEGAQLCQPGSQASIAQLWQTSRSQPFTVMIVSVAVLPQRCEQGCHCHCCPSMTDSVDVEGDMASPQHSDGEHDQYHAGDVQGVPWHG